MRPAFRVRLGRDDRLRLMVLLALFAVVLGVAILTDGFDRITPNQVREWVGMAGVWAPALYMAGFLVRPLTLAPLTMWLVVGGIAFGWTTAALYALLGVNLGAAAVFLAARQLGRDVIVRMLGPRAARQPRGRWGARFVLSLQLFPLMNHDLLNVAAGCSSISYGRFLLGSSLGTLPGILLYTYAGSVLIDPGNAQFYVAFAVLAVLSLVGFVAARRGRRGTEPDEEGEPARRSARLRWRNVPIPTRRQRQPEDASVGS